MKRYFWLLSILLAIIAFMVLFNGCGRVELASNTPVILNYSYNQTHFSKEAKKEEKEKIISILNDKKYHSSIFVGELSCGFSEDVSIKVDNEIYEIACDNCPYIKVKSTEKYLFLTDEEAKNMREIFFNYGGFFPCE